MNKFNEMALLSGLPFLVDDFYIYPLRLKDIASIGEENYYSFLFLLTSDLNSIKEGLSIKDNNNYKNIYDFLVKNAQNTSELQSYILTSLSLFLKTEVDIHNNKCFYFQQGEQIKIINESNFNQMVEIIKAQNCLKKVEESERQVQYKTEKGRQALEKLQKLRKEYKSKGKSLTLSQIINFVVHDKRCSYEEVFNMTYYQLINSYNYLSAKDNYDIEMKYRTSGQFKMDGNVKHWIEAVE